MKKVVSIGLLVSLLVLMLPLAQAQDSREFPQMFPPTGPYAVGRTAYHWSDETREEVHTPEDPDDVRELVVEVWYPAEPEPEADLGLYLQPPLAELFNQMHDTTGFPLIRANVVQDAPLASDEDVYPVVVFDPGFSIAPREYSMLLEEIASHGYVVFGIYHPYVSRLTVYPDGRVIEPLSADRLASIWAPQERLDGEFEHMWLPDMLFVLDQIAATNEDDPKGQFTGRLDAGHVGLVGHSQGARTVSEVCLIDARCVAAINMDGRRSAEVDLTLTKPFMVMLADDGIKPFASLFENGFEALANDFYVIMIPRSNHMSFSDTAFWAPFVFPAETMDERGLAIAQVTLFDYRLYAVAFLDQYVRGLESPLLDGPSEEHMEVFFLARREPIDPPTAGVEPQPAVLGGNVGEIAVGEAAVWAYEGTAGEVLDLWLMADNPAGRTTAEQREENNLMDTFLVVRAPDGNLLAANDDTRFGTDSALENLELPDDGVYHIEVRTWENQTGGGYSLIIESDQAAE